MKKYLLIGALFVINTSCADHSKKGIYTELLKEKIGDRLPFNEVKIAEIEGGTAVIVDEFNCYWIDSNNKVYCVNGASKSVLHNQITGELECEDAPIKSNYSDINLIAK